MRGSILSSYPAFCSGDLREGAGQCSCSRQSQEQKSREARVSRENPMRAKWKEVLVSLGVLLVIALTIVTCGGEPGPTDWTADEIETLRELWIGSLPPLPHDPSNAFADDPRAAALGQHLFFDTRFSSNGKVSCATCHQPQLMFTDGMSLAQGVGRTGRSAPTVLGTAYSPWQFWDGRKDSQWAQALGPLESPVEHGSTRGHYARLVQEHYRTQYEEIFGDMPDISDREHFPDAAGPVADPDALALWEAMAPEDREIVTRIYANIGKAIAAYERLILPGASPFDTFVDALLKGDKETVQSALTPDEVAGLRLYIGKAGCTECHSGPLFTNNDFHNLGVPADEGLPKDEGRALGVQQVLADEFNCLSPYSDATPEQCEELRSVKSTGEELVGAFKTPTLRNIAETAPYMHAGQHVTLSEVVVFYNGGGGTGDYAGTKDKEIRPLSLTDEEKAALVAFLKTLTGQEVPERLRTKPTLPVE